MIELMKDQFDDTVNCSPLKVIVSKQKKLSFDRRTSCNIIVCMVVPVLLHEIKAALRLFYL